ncbi:HAD family hydrolase [bacterium]|nr:HAD family hydrolase [bacterium]
MAVKVLALDFDGVIWNTQRESYHVSQIVWEEMFGRRALCSEQTFLSGRWLARAGEEFALIMLLAEEMRKKEPGRESFDLSSFSLSEFTRRAEENGGLLSSFGKNLADMRIKMRESDLRRWLGWQNIYAGIKDAVDSARARGIGIAVCTTKDKSSAEALLDTVGLKLPIWGKECSLDKRITLQKLIAGFQAEASEVLFVDDLLNNLLHVRPLGTNLAMASWGYNVEASRREARRLGIEVLNSPREIVGLLS